MTLFWIGLVTIILSIILMIISICDEKLGGSLLSAFFLFFGLIFMVSFTESEKQSIQTRWNEGKCIIDNGTMDLFQVTGTRSSVYYVYKCDTCGHSETFNRSMK